MPTPASKPPTGSCWPTPRMKARKGIVGAARIFERDVGGSVGKVGDVDRALGFQRFARISGDRDRHVLQILLAAAGGDDDVGGIGLGAGGIVDRLVDLGRFVFGIGLGECRDRGCQSGEGAAELEGGEEGSVAGHVRLLGLSCRLGVADSRQGRREILDRLVEELGLLDVR